MPGLNTARHLFLEEAERGFYADWETCTLDVVGHLRLAAGTYPRTLAWPRSSASWRWAASASAASGPARTCAPAHMDARRTGTRWSDCWNCTRRTSRYRTNQAWNCWCCPRPPAALPRTGCACSPAWARTAMTRLPGERSDPRAHQQRPPTAGHASALTAVRRDEGFHPHPRPPSRGGGRVRGMGSARAMSRSSCEGRGPATGGPAGPTCPGPTGHCRTPPPPVLVRNMRGQRRLKVSSGSSSERAAVGAGAA